MNNQTQLQQELAPVVEALKLALGDDLVVLVLFGSRARGDATPESDWDVLLIAEGLPSSKWQRSQFIHALLPPAWRYRANVLLHTPDEWFRRVTPLALDISLDGVLLYDGSNGLFPARLAALRQQLRALGLAREQIGSEWLWLWQDKLQPTKELAWV